MNDVDWLFLLMACYHGLYSRSEFDRERENDMDKIKNSIREMFEDVLRSKLQNPEISASDVNTLAHAYSELTKNDNLREMMQSVSGIGCIGSAANTNGGTE